MKLSIIIPTFNEAQKIGQLISYLRKVKDPIHEIIVIDGGSTDDTMARAKAAGADAILSPEKGRGAQMHAGAERATGDVLYFVHADVFPPATFVEDIRSALAEGYDFGRYYMHFDTKKWYLRINEYFTRFDFFVCYGGDQTLFVKKEIYEKSGGFRTDMRIMEDFEFTDRLKKMGRYKIMKKGALISDRKYDNNSWWKVQKANYSIVQMYKKGASQEAMLTRYKNMLNW